MPIKIADSLPARAILESENIFVMTEHRATTQDIRPLHIALLNLMPLKIVTETQILRCLSNTPIQIEVDLIQTKTYHSKNTPEDHLLTFYKTFDDIRDKKYDGLIITGAPVENMPFEEVEYWDELVEIMDWSRAHVHSTLHICWGAQAGLYHHYGIPKYQLPTRCPASSGIMFCSRKSPCCADLTISSARRIRATLRCAPPTSARMTGCACWRSPTRRAFTSSRL